MGAKAVGSLQYNENDLVEADVKVHVSHKTFSLNESSEEVKNEGLRKRDVKDIEGSIEEIKLSDDDGTPIKKKNPITWFGILVPQALRQSQARFQKAADLACRLATLKCKYTDLQEKYRDLTEKKHNLLNESVDFENFS